MELLAGISLVLAICCIVVGSRVSKSGMQLEAKTCGFAALVLIVVMYIFLYIG